MTGDCSRKMPGFPAESANLIATIFNAVDDRIALVDEHGKIQFANQAWHLFIGRAQDVPKHASQSEPMLEEVLRHVGQARHDLAWIKGRKRFLQDTATRCYQLGPGDFTP